MTPRITPDDSHTVPSSETFDQDLSYSDSSNSELESGYIPEREFVLMPLFRRLGQMFGLRRNEEPEYVYTPESVAPPPRAVTEAQVEPISASMQTSEIVEEAPLAPSAVTDDILGIEPKTEEAVAVAQPTFTQSEAVIPTPARFEPAVEQVAEQSIQEPAWVESARLDEDEFKPQPVEKLEPVSPASVVAYTETPEPTVPVAPMTRQDAQDLAAQIRDATAKISAAVTQAAAWLHTKEEEILRRAEMPLEPEKPVETPRTARFDSAPVVSLSGRDQASELEKDEVPALQREVAWQSERGQSTAGIAQPLTPESRKRRLSLVSKPAGLPVWRRISRINWAQQFTPKRVAILGASIMAILIVLGISFARHPAADELPQQTRAIDHGGVTLTTHPQTVTATPQPQAARQAGSSKPAPRSQAHQARNYDNGPDVVTHYYGKPKPSPIRQTATTGVRHYSDVP
jgi:hypothetical protein